MHQMWQPADHGPCALCICPPFAVILQALRRHSDVEKPASNECISAHSVLIWEVDVVIAVVEECHPTSRRFEDLIMARILKSPHNCNRNTTLDAVQAAPEKYHPKCISELSCLFLVKGYDGRTGSRTTDLHESFDHSQSTLWKRSLTLRLSAQVFWRS